MTESNDKKLVANANPPLAQYPGCPNAKLRTLRVNGINMRFAEMGPADGPMILFIHGWPESWYSWRHQLPRLAAEGYRCIAPDMRGYGGSDAPEASSEYTVHRLCGDCVQLANALGHDKFFVVGHDFGGMLAWQLALLHPDLVLGIAGVATPYTGRGKVSMNAAMYKKYGDPNGPEKEKSKFYYVTHHNIPGAGKYYEEDLREALYRIYGGGPRAKILAEGGTPPEIDSKMMYVNGKPEATWRRLPHPKSLPKWLKEEDLDVYVNEFKNAQRGFDGGVSWYRAPDMSHNATPQLAGAKVKMPALFIGGDADVMMGGAEGLKKIAKAMEKHCEQLKPTVIVPGCGHWLQQEAPEQVNDALSNFFKGFSSADREQGKPVWGERKAKL